MAKVPMYLIAGMLWCGCGFLSETVTAQTPILAESEPEKAPRVATSKPRIMENKFLKHLPKKFEMPTDHAGRLLLREYGSVFVAGKGVGRPTKVVFRDEAEVAAFQSTLDRATETIGTYTIELQTAAMKALNDAITYALSAGLSITPRDIDASRRGYDDTVYLWASRVEPALEYWVQKGRLKQEEADRLRSMTAFQQVPRVLELEKDGIYFAKDLSKSIIYSVAPPGASQHLSMLAFDINEYDDPQVRNILANHGWFQTVISDLPHFTFLGLKESELPDRGLRLVISGDRRFWVPDIRE
ncbi:MAG: hypothetical protein ABR530_08650 [Pyrinomonadaceae bacterium]